MFPTGRSGREISREIWGFEVSREIYVGIPGNFFYISKDFRGRLTDIHHFDIKNELVQIKKFFLLTKNDFTKFTKFLRKNACLNFFLYLSKFFLNLSKKLKNSR